MRDLIAFIIIMLLSLGLFFVGMIYIPWFTGTIGTIAYASLIIYVLVNMEDDHDEL